MFPNTQKKNGNSPSSFLVSLCSCASAADRKLGGRNGGGDESSIGVVVHDQSSPTPCNPRDCSPPSSSVHGIFQARILEWVTITYSRGSSQPRDQSRVSCTAGGFLTTKPPGKPMRAGVVVKSPGCARLFATPCTAAHQVSLSLTISQSLPKFMSLESVMPSNHLIL